MFSPDPSAPGEPAPDPEEGPADEGSEVVADGRLRRFDPRHVPCSRLGGGLFTAGLLVVLSLGLVYLALGEELRPARLVLLSLVALLVAAGVGIASWILPALELRHSRWRLTPAMLEIREGVWFRHVRTVPRTRVQHTDVERGPIERRFGLATLVVFTAGHQNSEIRLDGLAHGTATAIRDYLLAEDAAHGA